MTVRLSLSRHPLTWQRQMYSGLSRFFVSRRRARKRLCMWTTEQRQRLGLEHAILQQEGFSQFSVYWNREADTYYASGTAISNSGRRYGLHISIPSGFPYERPPMYVTEPFPLLMADGSRVTSVGLSHQMHALSPLTNGLALLCHWRDARW